MYVVFIKDNNHPNIYRRQQICIILAKKKCICFACGSNFYLLNKFLRIINYEKLRKFANKT